MKIIKYGKVKPTEVVCPECNAVLEYTPQDVNYNIFNERNFVNCPCCDKKIEVWSY